MLADDTLFICFVKCDNYICYTVTGRGIYMGVGAVTLEQHGFLLFTVMDDKKRR
jgi:hypothetical protein